MKASLTRDERTRLADLETQIGNGLRDFVRVGKALLEVRDRQLYRGSYPSFAAYCQDRWHLGRAHVFRLIAASEVADNLKPEKGEMSPTGDISEPTSERQVRPIAEADLEPEQQREAWSAAHEIAGGPPTSADVETAVAALASIEALSAGEQAEAVERAESGGRRNAVSRDGHAKRLQLARRHSRRLRLTLEGFGLAADRALSLVDQLDDALSALEAS